MGAHPFANVFKYLAVTYIIYCVRGLGQSVLAITTLGSFVHHPLNALNNIIDVGEVALAVAVVENLDCFALAEHICKAKVCHIGPTGRAIYGEEPQARRGNVVELAVRVGQQLVTLLGCSIETHWVIYLIISRIGHLLVAAVYRAARSVNEVLNAPLTTIVAVAASLQDVVETNQVALDVGIWVGD